MPRAGPAETAAVKVGEHAVRARRPASPLVVEADSRRAAGLVVCSAGATPARLRFRPVFAFTFDPGASLVPRACGRCSRQLATSCKLPGGPSPRVRGVRPGVRPPSGLCPPCAVHPRACGAFCRSGIRGPSLPGRGVASRCWCQRARPARLPAAGQSLPTSVPCPVYPAVAWEATRRGRFPGCGRGNAPRFARPVATGRFRLSLRSECCGARCRRR